MGKFAKIIELDDEQVLLVINWNDDDEVFKVSIQTDISGITARLKASFENEEDAIKMMDSYTVEQATTFRDEMKKMFDIR